MSDALDPGIPPAVAKLLDEIELDARSVYDAPLIVEEVQRLRSSISDALREATRVERERCALIAESHPVDRSDSYHKGRSDAAEYLAKKMRRSPTSDATRAHNTNGMDCWCDPWFGMPCDECDAGCWKCKNGLIELSREEANEYDGSLVIMHHEPKGIAT